MVNSFGATKKAPYTDAPNRATTAAAPRSFAVILPPFMYFLTLMSFALNRSELFSLQVLYYHTDSQNPGGRGYPTLSFFQQILPEKPYRRQKNHVERDQERQPVPAKHGILRKQRSGSLRAGDQQRRQQC